ncbi:uncharacterized protein DFL_008338 [Arthrobotrys flagrans]|uniref:Uncharacterized protein n=1 Tax=Arthrobotrys flagrans TaxID=97331 RepID=A0A436ZNG0_ARTFL|nr:hypothetical protein DFL_008338 [Arthrobotrys flagrans]
MGFLELGKRSKHYRRPRPAVVSKEPPSSVMSSQSEFLDLTPTANFRTTPFERLPVELLQRIFLFSYNTELPFTNRFLLSILSSPYLIQTFASSAVLDDALSTRQYRIVISSILTRRFLTLQFLENLETALWNKYFKAEFEALVPATSQGYRLENVEEDRNMGHLEFTFVDMESIEDATEVSEREVEKVGIYVPVLDCRMILGKLDLRTIPFPKIRLLNPPFTLEKVKLISALATRMPSFWVDLIAGDEGKWWGSRLLEIAVRRRCAAMVDFLANFCYVRVEPMHLRAAVMPWDHGNTGWLEPEFSKGGRGSVVQGEDVEMMRALRGLGKKPVPMEGTSNSGIDGFVKGMRAWKNGKGLVKSGWGQHEPEIEDSLRILWALDQVVERKGRYRIHGSTDFANVDHFEEETAPWLLGENRYFPTGIAESPLMADEKVWEAARQEKGVYWRWLMKVGAPPAGFLSM